MSNTPAILFLICCLAGLSVAGLVYVGAKGAGKGYDAWRRRFQSEADMAMEEMLYLLPGQKYTNYSLGAASLAAAVVFLGVTASGRTWNWHGGFIFGAGAFVLTIAAARFLLRLLRARRLEKFNDQLEESLLSMGNALKAGFSIMQTIEMVVKQNRYPISIEFSLMFQQTRLGMSFDDALKNMAQRVHSEDFDLVASAIRTARQTGGDLTGVFERLAALIRERRRIQRRIMTLTAQGRLQGRVLAGLPFILLGVLYLLDPAMITDFFTRPVGIALLLVVLVLETLGFLVIRRIVNIEI